jgi:hypothetical protein
MPVYKFRSVEDMNQERWRQPGDPALYQAIATLWEFGRRTRKHRFEPGVRRFTGIAAMSEAQDMDAKQRTRG